MFHSYASENAILTPAGERLTDVIWVDVENPTAAEEMQIKAAFGIEIPSREDMEEIEISSRLYSEGKATYMTLRVFFRLSRPAPSGPVKRSAVPNLPWLP